LASDSARIKRKPLLSRSTTGKCDSSSGVENWTDDAPIRIIDEERRATLTEEEKNKRRRRRQFFFATK